MMSNFKILFSVTIAFTISFLLLFSYMELYELGKFTSNLIEKEEIEKFNERKNIFLLGSSFVGSLNSSHIENYLKKNNLDSNVYNVRDNKIFRMVEISDSIILANPDIIVYGIGYRDIGYIENDCLITNDFIPYNNKTIEEVLIQYESKKLFDPSEIIDAKNPKFELFDLSEFHPKYITIELLRHYLKGEKSYELTISNQSGISEIPLGDFKSSEIVNIDDLNSLDSEVYGMCYDYRDQELDNLRIVMNKLIVKEPRIIIFIPPFTQSYIEKMPPELRESLTTSVFNIAKEFDAEFYDLSEHYKSSNIFEDHTHIAKNPKSIVFSEDIAKIILGTK
ncbi:MAG: D-alanyl-lipoteichoic acid biosynthesis protein DltD [Nitrosopumilaceae archaeon]